MQLARHSIVYLGATYWPDILDSHPAARAIPTVVGWVDAGNPLIARRPVCADTGQKVALGLPLPPALGKLRIAVEVAPEAIASAAPPPHLSDVITVAPTDWRRTLQALIALDAETRCFGSLAWAALTGLDYLSEVSDLDLLWSVDDRPSADALAVALAAIQAQAPMRLDGEFVTASGMAAQWREWASDAPGIIAKTADGVQMVTREALFS